MSENSILDKYVRKSDDTSQAAQPEEVDVTEDLGAFGWLRGVRDRALMLEFRKKNGNSKAVGLAWLHEAEFDPSTGILLQLGSRKVRIIGRNLNAEVRPNARLFQGIIWHRVPWVQEANEVMLMKAGERDTVIERIEW